MTRRKATETTCKFFARSVSVPVARDMERRGKMDGEERWEMRLEGGEKTEKKIAIFENESSRSSPQRRHHDNETDKANRMTNRCTAP